MMTESATAAVPLTMDWPVTEGNRGYELSRFNAMRHGILLGELTLMRKL